MGEHKAYIPVTKMNADVYLRTRRWLPDGRLMAAECAGAHNITSKSVTVAVTTVLHLVVNIFALIGYDMMHKYCSHALLLSMNDAR